MGGPFFSLYEFGGFRGPLWAPSRWRAPQERLPPPRTRGTAGAEQPSREDRGRGARSVGGAGALRTARVPKRRPPPLFSMLNGASGPLARRSWFFSISPMKNMDTSKDGQSSHESVGMNDSSRDGLVVRLNRKRVWSFLKKNRRCHFGRVELRALERS